MFPTGEREQERERARERERASKRERGAMGINGVKTQTFEFLLLLPLVLSSSSTHPHL